MKLGVRLESLGAANFRSGLAAAARLGAQGVQVDAVGDLHPDRLGGTARREVSHLVRSQGLSVTALHCPLRHGLDNLQNLEPRIAHLQKAMTLSVDLGARLVIVDAGRIPEKADDPRHKALREALTALGAHGDRIGAVFALEAGAEPGGQLATFLDSFAVAGLAVNYDPGSFLTHGMDPTAELRALKGRVSHVHAHDARATAHGRKTVSVGAGDVDWLAIIATLTAMEYSGWMVVENDEPDAAAIAAGVGFLKRLL